MVDLSVVVMAHPLRQLWAEEIAAETGASIVWDQVGHPWDTGRRALLAGTGSHVMVLQDDSVLSAGLVESVTSALEYSGDHPVGLYSTAGRVPAGALELGAASWWSGDGPTWGVAVVIPVPQVEALVRFGDRYRSRSYDQRLWHYYRGRSVCWYTVPSLVDHRTGHGSLLGKGRDRKAQRFGSGLEVDWSIPPVLADRHTLYPVIKLSRGAETKRVRKGTRAYRDLIARGWQILE
jgi:hypothetical protein